ncbi:MAG: hypothetical protein H8E44_24825 [Planctomycetes bacterium]|nr:hypothetical protein [Planctomycetota bacterium]MBL7043088.1 hypothetical protein [Pirellulaceae bacterium]
MKPTVALAILGLVLVFASVSEARTFKDIGYQAMLEKADLVVIAIPVRNKDMPERTEVIGVPVIGVQTTFGVMAVLKGSLKGGTFNLHHYRFDTETIKSDTRFVYDHHAGLAEFGKGNDGVEEVYLLFLKQVVTRRRKGTSSAEKRA